MKRIVEDETISSFESSLGKRVVLFCGIYIYAGVLSGVNDDCVELQDPVLVYETGDLTSGQWKDGQTLPQPWRVMRQSIESWGPAKC